MPACLMYLDFFSISAQNKALTVTANCCVGLLPEELCLVVECLPILATRLAHEDKQSVELACMSLARLADSYKLDTARLAQLARAGMHSQDIMIYYSWPELVCTVRI